MNSKALKTAGILLIFSSLTFWLAWFLMPDQGTADTEHILNIVKQNRYSVLASVIIQIIASVTYIPALFFLAKGLDRQKNTTFAGLVLLAVGAMGMCMDAFFHLQAYYMTHNSVNIGADIITLMTFMQTEALAFLVPLLVLFFIGTLVLAIGLFRQKYITRLPYLTGVAAFVTAIVGGIVISKFIGSGMGHFVLFVLAMFAFAQAVMGFQFLKHQNTIN